MSNASNSDEEWGNQMEKLDLPIEDLFLDLLNPRLGRVDTQSEALRAIIDLGVTYFRNMMNSVKEHGLDPGDSFYIMSDEDEDETYIVVDGNRRLAAIKTLIEPAVLASLGLPAGQLKLLQKAAEGFERKKVDAVSCVLFDNRDVADDWIERRHGKDLAGEARLNWGPLEIERFQKDQSNLDVIDFVGRNSTMSDEDWATTKSAVEKNSSLLKRFLSSKAGKSWLGYASTKEDDGSKLPVFGQSSKMVLGVLEKLFADIRSGAVTSRSYNSADDIAGYFESLPAGLKPKAASAKPVKFRDAKVQDGSKRPRQDPQKAVAAKAAAPKTARAKGPRLTLAEKQHLFSQPETAKGQRLVHEASRQNTNDFPIASAYLLRAFIEHTVDTYMEAHGIPRVEGKQNLDLTKRTVRVCDHLIQTKAIGAQKLQGAKRLTNTNDPASIQALNDYHHDRYQVPPADALRSAWDACVPLFIAVYGPAK
jgi:hypothetical protein